MPRAVRRTKNATVIAIAVLARLLLDGRRSLAELAAETGLNINTVQRYCAAFHNTGAAFIANWRLDGRGAYSIRIYQLGEGVDLPPPVKGRDGRIRYMKAYREGKHLKAHTKKEAYGI